MIMIQSVSECQMENRVGFLWVKNELLLLKKNKPLTFNNRLNPVKGRFLSGQCELKQLAFIAPVVYNISWRVGLRFSKAACRLTLVSTLNLYHTDTKAPVFLVKGEVHNILL